METKDTGATPLGTIENSRGVLLGMGGSRGCVA